MIKVLIIEDDPMVAEINISYIKKVKDFNIVGWAKNGEKAFDFIDNNQVDLLILDIYMPKVDGIELLEQLRRNYSNIDVIFVTAAREPHIIDKGLKLGAVDYLIKPFTFERLKIALEKYKERLKLLSNSSEIDQSDIDRLFETHPEDEFPKGIHIKTLNKIKDYILNLNSNEIDLDKMSYDLNVSTVTSRHYLEYLVSINIIQKEIKYGDIGRPKNIYLK